MRTPKPTPSTLQTQSHEDEALKNSEDYVCLWCWVSESWLGVGVILAESFLLRAEVRTHEVQTQHVQGIGCYAVRVK